MNTTEYSILSVIYRRFILQPLGLSTDNSIVVWLLILFGSITVGSLWYFQGNIPVVLSVVYICGIFLLSFLRVDYSLYVLLSAVLIFDQFSIPGFSSATYQVNFFSDLKNISHIPFFEAGIINPVELQLGLIILSLLFLLAIKKDFTWRPLPVFIPFGIFLLLFVGAFAYGIGSGGDLSVAVWEVRAFIYFFLLYLIVPQIIRTREQIRILVWIFVIGISFKAIQGVGRFIELDFAMGELQSLTNQEDPMFIITLLMLLIGLFVFKVKDKQRVLLFILLPLLMVGFYVGMQWAAYIALLVTLLTFTVLLPLPAFLKFMKYSLPFVAVVGIYVGLFWNSNERLGQPVQFVRSTFKQLNVQSSSPDLYSSLHQDAENYNLAQTVVANPLSGTGFGQKYDQAIPLVFLSFSMREYMPQNGILWILVKMGAIGFLSFWFFFNAFVAKAVKVFQRLTDPYLKVILMVVTVTIINLIVISYFDLQLTYYRNMIFLGCLMGLLPAIEQYTKTNSKTDLEKKTI